MERVLLIPGDIRCLGNIIIPKNSLDFTGLNSKWSEEKLTIGDLNNTVFTLEPYFITNITMKQFKDWYPIVNTNNPLVLNGVLKDYYGKLLHGLEVYLIDLIDITDNQGEFTFNITEADHGTNSFEIIFPGTDKYQPSSIICTIDVGCELIPTIHDVVDQYELNSYKFKVTTIKGVPVKDVNLKLTIKDSLNNLVKEYTLKTDSNGECVFNHMFTKPGDYQLILTGDYELSYKGKVHVNKSPIVWKVLENTYKDIKETDYFIKNLVYRNNQIIAYDKLVVKNIEDFTEFIGVVKNMQYVNGEWVYDTVGETLNPENISLQTKWTGLKGAVINLDYDYNKYLIKFTELNVK